MEKKFAAGIDVGGTFIKYTCANSKGEMLFSSKLPIEEKASAQSVIKSIQKAIEDCKTRVASKRGRIIGVGVGFPGVVSNGTVLGGANNLDGFSDVPLSKILMEKTGLDPIVIDNDANMMGWGEVMYGCAEHIEDAVFLTVGTGIGGAMVIDGKLYGGHKNRGAEMGHIIVKNEGLKCSCGSSGCLEAYASVTALINKYSQIKKLNKNTITGKIIVENYLAKEPEAIAAMNWHFNYLSAGIASFINIFSPERIIIGGGIAESGDFYINALKEQTHSVAMEETQINTTIQAAKLGNWAGCLGCTSRVFSLIQN